MSLTTRNVRVNGYPPLDVVLAHFDAIPVLVRTASPEAIAAWDLARNVTRTPLALQAISGAAERVLNREDDASLEKAA